MNNKFYISDHVSYKEAIRSQTAKKKGVENEPDDEQLLRMKILANEVFEPLRIWANCRIYISSFFRSIRLNSLIGGSSSSQHCALKGAALDLDADVYGGVTNLQIFEFIRDNLEFDQLIWEFGTNLQPDWVHVSFNFGENRGNVLRAIKENGKTYYSKIA